MKFSVLRSFARHGVQLAVLFVFLVGMAGIAHAQAAGSAAQPSAKTALPDASARTTAAAPLAFSPAVRTRALQMYAALPMSFEANAGQSDSRVKFLAHAPGYSLFLTDQEAILSLLEPSPAQEPLRAGDPLHRPKAPSRQNAAHPIRVRFLGANSAAVVAGSDELAAKSNYFIGNDPKHWHTNVPNYSAVKYSGIYPGVDAVFHGDNRRFEFDFDIAAGADPRSIALEVDGTRRMRLNRVGDVLVGMDAAHQLVMNKPRIYQQLPEGRREIAGHYVLGARNRIAFAIGPYDHTRPLVIDPTLVYSTYLDAGGTTQGAGTYANAIAIDSASLSDAPHGEPIDCSAGCAVVTGTTENSTLPFPTTSGSYDPGPPPAEGGFPFIAKFNANGSGLVYSTYFGGSYENISTDQIYAIAVDSTGAAYFGGISGAYDDTPTTPGSYEPVRPGEYPAPFVAKLSPDGSTLVYGTYLDGTGNSNDYFDAVSGIAVDSSFSAYVTGNTVTTNFPTTTGAFQTLSPANYGYASAFVTKLSADGSSLVYSTYLGGSESENILGSRGVGAIALDSSNDAYLTGNTSSSNFPTMNPYIAACSSPCSEAFVSELNPTGTGLVYSTFLGGTTANKDSVGLGIAVDSSNCASLSQGKSCAVFVGGDTSFTNFPVTSNVVQSSPGVGFITKLAPGGTGLVYSSYFNGYVDAVAVGADDSAVLFGLSNMALPFESTEGAFTLPACTNTEAEGPCVFDFISKLTADGSGLIFSTPIGANQESEGAYGALDSTGNAYIDGTTSSTQLPTTAGSFEPTLPSNSTASDYFYVAKVAFSSSSSPISISPSTLPYGIEGESYSENLTATGGSGSGYTWSVISGGTALTNVGLSLTTGGMISGMPNATEAAAAFTVQVTDSQGNTATQDYTLTIYPALSVTPTTLPAGTVGTPYSQALTASGAAGSPYGWSATGLPTGLSISSTSPTTGTISGTPTAAGTFSVTVTVSDALGDHGNLPYSLTINAVAAPLTISPTTLPAGTAGTPYSQTLTASGGSGTGYSWAITSGATSLGDIGLTLSLTGTIIGIPVAGQANFTVQVTDSLGDTATQSYMLTITAPAPIASLSPTSLSFAAQVSGTQSPAQTVTLSNTGNAPLSLSGPGLGISISGANATDFAQTNPCGASVAAGSNCAISVTFTPSLSAGSETATLNVADNAAGTPQQVQLSGIALPPASVSCTIPTVTPSGDAATVQITCTATDFAGTIAMECNLPASLSQYITCSFSPSSLNFASSATQTTTLTIQPVQGAFLERKSLPGHLSPGAVAFGAVFWLPGCIFVMRRKKGKSMRGVLLLLILVCSLLMTTSCGGSSSSGPPTPPAGTYQASVVLTGPGLNETITFTIQVP